MKRIALVHHWLTGIRGGEKVLEQFCEIFPNAPLFTLLTSRNKKNYQDIIKNNDVIGSLMDNIPFVEKYYQMLFPFYPIAIQNISIEADFILSSDANMIKGFNNKCSGTHVCYTHSPPRYLWDQQESYLSNMPLIKAKVFEKVTPYLREFDLRSASKVDYFISNSKFVSNRVRDVYKKESVVIYPPVSVEDFVLSFKSEDFYLVVSALVPYKRIDVAVKAFNKLNKKLVVIGKGSELNYLKSIANKNIIFLGSQPFKVLVDFYSRCRAFIFPGVEDFGITPLEAQASGKPVVAFNDGGALETVISMKTGVFFEEQSVESLIDAIEVFEGLTFSPEICRKNAENFNKERFKFQIKQFIKSKNPNILNDE